MKSIKFSESIEIKCTPQLAFDYTQDYNNRLQWDTFLKRADLSYGASEAGLGIKAYCVAKNGLGMETEYVSFNRPKATAVKMTKGPLLFEEFLGSWNFKEIQSDHTQVIFLYSLRLRFPFNLASGLITANLRQNVKQRLHDLKLHIENRTNHTARKP